KGERRAPSVEERRAPTDLGPDSKQEIDNILRRGPVAPKPDLDARLPDNSNTQFAILALWTARRYGVPVEDALARVEKRFRGSQNADGGWGYQIIVGAKTPFLNSISASTAAMTCAGLLGLAMHHAVASESALRAGPKGAGADAKRGGNPKSVPDIAQDRSVKAGFQYLA